ncbi:hypothetical protein AVEN_55690-1 [Araneus ventricosus]|uniref:Uncharacterized protein n=1 Tax=Araneus ventricosus TaxID=182803 RepID=A0A4Y2IY04_ARAVE|nr:hypothetical protein AVEN_55690-1 [Araneus ventricosus]
MFRQIWGDRVTLLQIKLTCSKHVFPSFSETTAGSHFCSPTCCEHVQQHMIQHLKSQRKLYSFCECKWVKRCKCQNSMPSPYAVHMVGHRRCKNKGTPFQKQPTGRPVLKRQFC